MPLQHDIDILIEDDRWAQAGLQALADPAVQAVLDCAGLTQAAVSLLASDDTRIAALNAQFLGKPQPTNVLSWPEADLAAAQDGAPPRPPQPGPDGAVSLGDIALAYETCTAEAAAQNKPFAHHVTHLIVHGTLHLLGYDHERGKDATRMETLEVEILGILGVPDPY